MTGKLMLATVIAALGIASPALGAERWASPTGSGTACTQASPCSLVTATDDLSLNDGDEVIVTPGNYSVTNIIITNNVAIHGQDGQPRPTITFSGVFGLYLFSAADGAHVRDLNLTNVTAQAVLGLGAPGIVAERINAYSPVGGAIVCALYDSVILRDSVCWGSGTNSRAVGANLTPLDGDYDVKLRNVTAAGVNSGLGFGIIGGSGVDFSVDAKNVIAQGGSVDVVATASGGASNVVTLANSNYATEIQNALSGSTVATVTNPGTGTNQMDEPLFVNAMTGDFHQLPGSPTIDAGAEDPDLGTNDFEGDQRVLNGNGICPTVAIPDIGADEIVSAVDCPGPPDPPNPPAGDTDPPETTISKAPKKKIKSKKKKAKVSATFTSDEASTFECSIDGGSFSACTSPLSFKAQKGKHSIAVRAVDTAGNVDATPATANFTVKVKKKR